MRLCGRAMDEDNDGVPDFNDNRYFMGQVAHVSVYDFALSQSQVANPNPNPNPKAYKP